MTSPVSTPTRYARGSLLFAAVLGSCLLGLSAAAATLTGTVTLKGNVESLAVPTCTYDMSGAVSLYDIPFETIKNTSDIETLLSSQITPGQISTNGAVIKNTVSNQIYQSTNLAVKCSNLTKGFSIKASPIASPCAGAGCSYLRVSSYPAELNEILSLAVFTFTPRAGQSTPNAIWWDLNKTNGTTSGNAHSVFNATETAAVALSKNIEVGFLLVKKNGSTWPASIDSGTYLFSSSFELSIVYE